MKELDEKLRDGVRVMASGCWEWRGGKDRDGYGRIYVRRGYVVAAHRAAYESAKGKIPDGFDVDHKCWNRACCNPSHLRVLSKTASRKRQRSAMKKHCQNGHEYSFENTYRRPNGRRDCRACIRERVRRYTTKIKAV